MPLLDLQALLPTLPDQLIVLADHAILVDQDGWQQLYNDITSVSYLAARFLPFIQLDEYDRIVGPSPEAEALIEFFLHGSAPTISIPAYSSQVLVFITPLHPVTPSGVPKRDGCHEAVRVLRNLTHS